MQQGPLSTFTHPAKAYRLRYPAEWEHLIKEEGRSCGFGPRDRDNVGLWISIMPMSIDTDRLSEDLGRLFQQSIAKAEAINLRRDTSLRHFGFKADMTAEKDGGHYWIVSGGDLVLFASSQVPPAEREVWNPQFDRLMASLEITREEELVALKVTNGGMSELKERFPEQEYEFDSEDGTIRGPDNVIYLSNLRRQVMNAPDRLDEIVQQFVTGLAFSADDAPAADRLDAVRELILPALKPFDYVRTGGPTAYVVHRDWIGGVCICYAIQGSKTVRFVLKPDVERGGLPMDDLNDLAMENLVRLEWPRQIEGSGPVGQRVAIISTRDSLDAARLLHPGLHEFLSPVLGSPFLAGIPDRDTLVVFSSGNRRMYKRITAQLRKDYDRAAYPISPRAFLVTRDGIAMARR